MELPASLKDMAASGRKLLTDTKVRKAPGKSPATKNLSAPPETDPFKIFIRRCTTERPAKDEVVKDIQKFIKAAEADI